MIVIQARRGISSAGLLSSSFSPNTGWLLTLPQTSHWLSVPEWQLSLITVVNLTCYKSFKSGATSTFCLQTRGWEYLSEGEALQSWRYQASQKKTNGCSRSSGWAHHHVTRSASDRLFSCSSAVFFFFFLQDLVWYTEPLNINPYILFATRTLSAWLLNHFKLAESCEKQLNTAACSCCTQIIQAKRLSEGGRCKQRVSIYLRSGSWEWRHRVVSVPVTKSENNMAAPSCCC